MKWNKNIHEDLKFISVQCKFNFISSSDWIFNDSGLYNNNNIFLSTHLICDGLEKVKWNPNYFNHDDQSAQVAIDQQIWNVLNAVWPAF